jgi:UDPglucose 6-dehydrogenase
MKISFANFIGNICDKIPDANADNVTSALGEDRRISPYYIKAGLAFGGPCFPRDTWAFDEFSDRLGLDAVHIKAAGKINQEQHSVLYDKAVALGKNRIAIIGLGYKVDTSVTTDSPAIILADNLANDGYTVNVYDPLALDEAKERLGDKVNYFDEIAPCLGGSDCCVIATPYVEFKDLRTAVKRGYPMLDCWGIL